jgi:hypothetical protein
MVDREDADEAKALSFNTVTSNVAKRALYYLT